MIFRGGCSKSIPLNSNSLLTITAVEMLFGRKNADKISFFFHNLECSTKSSQKTCNSRFFYFQVRLWSIVDPEIKKSPKARFSLRYCWPFKTQKEKKSRVFSCKIHLNGCNCWRDIFVWKFQVWLHQIIFRRKNLELHYHAMLNTQLILKVMSESTCGQKMPILNKPLPNNNWNITSKFYSNDKKFKCEANMIFALIY